MSTVTANTLFSRAARYSSAAGATSLGCPKPAVVSLPFATNSGMKKTPRSVCYYADPSSIEHPSNIPHAALLQKSIPGMPPMKTMNKHWQITEEDKKLELTLFMPDRVEPLKEAEFEVTVEGNLLKISKKQQPQDDIWFDVQLIVPEFYNKEKIEAKIDHRNLLVTIPKYTRLIGVKK